MIKTGYKFILFLSLIVISPISYGGDAQNIEACVNTARDFANVTLEPFAAKYEGNFIKNSVVKWKNAYCEVKFAEVYTLQIDGRDIVYQGYAGKDAYDLYQKIRGKTDNAINLLNARIALLQQQSDEASKKLKAAKPDLREVLKMVDDGLNKSLKK